MAITRENYEPYFIDYLEGNLDNTIVDEFIEFIRNNPDLEEELKSFAPVTLDGESVTFAGKEKLYRELYDSQQAFDTASVAWYENDLNEEESGRFQDYLGRHPEKSRDFKLFGLVKLHPDKSVVFSAKKKLYHPAHPFLSGMNILRIAAVFILMFSLAVVLKKYTEIAVPESDFVSVQQEINTEIQKPKEKAPEKVSPEKVKTTPAPADTVKVKHHRSIREENRGRADGYELLAAVRDSVIFGPMVLRPAGLLEYEESVVYANLIPLKIEIQPDLYVPDPDEEILLADRIGDKTGLSRFRLSDIPKAGLKFLAGISNNKFSYDTDSEGSVTEINLETRLLAFSIPTARETEK